MDNYLFKAIRKLKPNAQFSFENEDYSTITWDVLDGSAPTQDEIDNAIKEIKADEISAAEQQTQAKNKLLERLGITEDEAKLLLS